MQKQLQKFGFFASKNLDEEARAKDKLIKCLYKKETGTTYKRKIKSANDAEVSSKHTSKRHSRDEKRRIHRKKSSESLGKNRRGSPINTFASETEIYFISPDELIKQRKKLVKHRDKSPERIVERKKCKHHEYEAEKEKKKSLKKENDNKKQKGKESDEFHILTKEDIVRLITHNTNQLPKKTSTTSNFLKRFFLFDKQDSAHDTKTKEKHSRKTNRYSDDYSHTFFLPYKEDSTIKKIDKVSKDYDRKFKEEPVNVVYSRDSRKHREERKKSKLDDASLVFEELKILQNKVKDMGCKFPPTDSIESSITTKPKPKRMSKGSEDLLLDQLTVLQQKESESKIKRRTKSKEVQDLMVDKVTESQQSSKKKRVSKNNVNEDLLQQETTRHRTLEKQVSNSTNASIKKKRKDTVIEKKITSEKKPLSRKASNASFTPKERAKSRSRNHSSERESSDASKKLAERMERLQDNKPRANPKRHRFCLVKNTFSVVQIEPTEASLMEKKKRNKTFKKYYKYSRSGEKDVELTSSSTYQTFSDSHKMYQEKSEQSFDGSKRPKIFKRNLKVVNNISSIVIDPEPQIAFGRLSESYRDIDAKARKSLKSRIPVLTSKTPETRRRNADTVKSPRDDSQETSSRPASPAVKVNKEASTDDSKISKSSSLSKQSKSNTDSIIPKPRRNRSRSKSRSPGKTHRKSSIDSSRGGIKSHEGSTTAWSKSSKRSCKSFTSKSDTKIQKIQKKEKSPVTKKHKTLEKSSARTSMSNSTCGDKSIASSKTGTSFLLTKNYKDDDKLTRWQKRKLYSDSIRKSIINKKKPEIPPQVMEIRYLSVCKESPSEWEIYDCPESEAVQTEKVKIEEIPDMNKDLFKDDLPQPCFELVQSSRFKELFELPVDEALNEILKENFDFLQKDFSLPPDNDLDKSTSSEDVTCEEIFVSSKKINDWYEFTMGDEESLSEISCCRKTSNSITCQGVDLGSQDHIVDSLSAPGSEESGYATIKSRQVSRSFFQRPEIRALLEPTVETSLDYCLEVQIERSSSSNCGLEIRSIESKSLQTTIECSQKSVQIKLSKEEIVENVNFSEAKNEEAEEEISVRSKEQSTIETEEQVLIEKTQELEMQSAISTESELPSVESESPRVESGSPSMDSKSPRVEVEEVTVQEESNGYDAFEVTKTRKAKKRKARTSFRKKLSFLSCVSCVSDD